MSDGKITIKSESQRALMRAAGELTGRTLNYIETLIKPGISTKELDEAAEEFIRSHGAVPSFLNYEGFPASICTSVNDRIVHGIPSRHDRLRDGDIISVDCGALLNGFHGDAARTFLVGNVAPEVAKLVQVTKELNRPLSGIIFPISDGQFSSTPSHMATVSFVSSSATASA